MVPGGLGEWSRGSGRRRWVGQETDVSGRGYQGWIDQWKILYEVVQGDHVRALLNCNRGEGCTGGAVNPESGMWVGVPQGC